MNTEDFYTLLDNLTMEIDWSYVESEGFEVTRFDLGYKSIWVYKTGSIDSLATMSVAVQKTVKNIIKELDLTITL